MEPDGSIKPEARVVSYNRHLVKMFGFDDVRTGKEVTLRLPPEWIAASDQAREQMTALADEQPDTPIGVAFVDAKGEPGWIRRDPSLRVHYPSLPGLGRPPARITL